MQMQTGSSAASAFAFCLLPFAFLSAQSLPRYPSATARTAIAQLQRDITQATQGPGVQRGLWGIAVHSLDRNERLFELQARALLVPASVAKIAAVATAAEAVGWDYQFETTIRATGAAPTASSRATSWSWDPAIPPSVAAPERICRRGRRR